MSAPVRAMVKTEIADYLVNIMFRCDNVKYRLASERPQEHRVNETLHED